MNVPEKQGDKTYRRAERIAHALVKDCNKFALWAVAVLLLCIPGLALLAKDNGYEAFLGKDNPDLKTVQWIQDRYHGAGEVLRVIYQPALNDILAPDTIGVVQAIQVQLSALHYVIEARTLLDEKILFAKDGTPEALPTRRSDYGVAPLRLVASALDVEIADLAAHLDNPVIRGRSIGQLHSTLSIQVRLDPNLDSDDLAVSLLHLQQHVEAIDDQVSTGSLLLAGIPLFDQQAEQVLQKDVRLLLPLALAGVIILLFLFFGNIKVIGLLLGLIVLSELAALGLAGYAGVSVNVMTTSAVLIIATLAVADGIHLLSAYSIFQGQENTNIDGLREALKINIEPFLITSVTTIFGYGCLLFSPSPAIRDVGLVVVFGVMMAIFFTLTLLPALLLKFSRGALRSTQYFEGKFRSLGIFCTRRAGLVLFVGAVACCGMFVGLSYNTFKDSMIGWFDENTYMYKGLQRLNDEYRGQGNVIVAKEVIDSDFAEITNPLNPENFEDLRDFSHRVVDDTNVLSLYDAFSAAKAFSNMPLIILDPMAQTTLTENEERKNRPGIAMLVSSGLMAPVRSGRGTFLLSHVNVKADTNTDYINNADKVIEKAEKHFAQRRVQTGSLGLSFARLSQENAADLLIGSIIVVIAVSLVLALAFRSLPLGGMVLIPNLAPILAIYGLWGYLDGTINLAAVTVLSVSLGIVVDDTVHIVTKWRHLRRYEDTTGSAALTAGQSLSVSGVGVALTSLLLLVGFFLLGQSSFLLTAQKANMVGGVVALALVFDVTILIAILSVYSRFSSRNRKRLEGGS